jgi:hypothetical protein
MGRRPDAADGNGVIRRTFLPLVAVVIAALVIVAFFVWRDGPAPALRGDQLAINLMVVKALHPGWFIGDPLYGSDYYRFYIPAFLGLQTTIARLAGGDPLSAIKILVWPLGVLVIVGHYLLFRALIGSPLAAALGAVSALAVRNALGGEYWGFDGAASVQPRVFAVALVPPLVLAFLRWRQRRLVLVFFLAVGLLTNIHPVTGLHLFEISVLAHLALARFRVSAWRDAACGAGLFALGALPFLVQYLPNRENVVDPAALGAVRAALDYRFDYLLLPQRLNAIFSVLFHALLPACVFGWLVRRQGWSDDLRTLTVLGCAALVVGVAGIAAIQGVAKLSDRPYVDIMQLRATKFAYLPLLAAFPLAFQELLARHSTTARLFLLALFALSLIPPGWMIHSFSEEVRDSVKQRLGLTRAAVQPTRSGSGTAEPPPLDALHRWVMTHADRNELFLTDSDAFRLGTLRPITGTFKDGAYLVHAGSAPFYRWYVYMRDVEGCRGRLGVDCWFEAAVRYRARYVVVDPQVSGAVAPAAFERVWSSSDWSVWRRR